MNFKRNIQGGSNINIEKLGKPHVVLFTRDGSKLFFFGQNFRRDGVCAVCSCEFNFFQKDERITRTKDQVNQENIEIRFRNGTVQYTPELKFIARLEMGFKITCITEMIFKTDCRLR